MGGSIKEYLERQPTEALKSMLLYFSQTDLIEKYGFALEFIEEELKSRDE